MGVECSYWLPVYRVCKEAIEALQIIGRLANFMAMAGGAVLIFLMSMVAVSVVGRGLAGVAWDLLPWVGPVKGDFELVELGMGFVIFAFLPLCQLRRGHAKVDLLAHLMPVRVRFWLDNLWEAVFAAVWIIIAWRLGLATSERMCLVSRWSGEWCNIETSFRLGIPVWWSYLPAFIAAVITAITALGCLSQRLRQNPTLPRASESEAV